MLGLQGKGQRCVSRREKGKSALAASLLEEVCGRAALLAGDVKGYAGACLGLRLDGGMADDPGEDEGGGGEGEVSVPEGCDNGGVGGAVLRDRREVCAGGGGVCRMRRSRAAMCAVASAAGRQICVGAGGEGQQRRDQRKAEEEEQREAEDTSHTVIVTSFAPRCVGALSLACGGRGEFDRVTA